MLNQLLLLCTSDTSLFWQILISDIAIAAAYFAIPLTMAVVLRHRKTDIPYPWLWTLFVIFIVACGMTHVVHAFSAVSGVEYLGLQAAIELITAVASVGTAIAFALILPQIKLLPSPAQQRANLEREVAQRTLEKDRLILEINHRIGNQLQRISSMVRLEIRNATIPETVAVLERLRTELDHMGRQHHELSQGDYLPSALFAEGGEVVASS